MTDVVRIGCAAAFYGDSQLAARQLVDGGDLDYLVFDYLAEATMAILGRAQAKNPDLGYAVDFVTVAMRDVLADCARRGIRVVANAGGVNVPACVAALEALRDELGLDLVIGGVYGDDLVPRASELIPQLHDIDSGEPLAAGPASLNAYLGARPIAAALAAGADVVVTGRIVDSALVLGPLLHAFGWPATAYDELAQGSLAGHIIECGAQCTGGNFTDWEQVPDFATMSYPIAAVAADGSFTVEIAPDTGGMVTPATVGEQLLYEISDPANYLLPDVNCDFSGVALEQTGADRVRVTGARGRAPGERYKVCATVVDGYRLLGSFFMAGPSAAAKARRNLAAWVERTRGEFARRGWPDYRDVCIEIVGAEDTYGPHAADLASREVMAKYGLHHDQPAALAFAAAELPYLATSAAPGMSGFGAGRARPQPLVRIQSGLLDKRAVPVTVQVGGRPPIRRTYHHDADSDPAAGSRFDLAALPPLPGGRQVAVPLAELVWARSGDKGDSANIGVMARHARYLPVLYRQLTAEAVAAYFAHLAGGPVQRYELPGIGGFNFVLHNALGGGATGSLRIDPQGKAYAQMLLSLPIEVPAAWDTARPAG